MSNASAPPETPLPRTVGLPQITLYGVGTIVGAGIYVLIGEVAVASGSCLAVSLLVAVIVASLSADSYDQLGLRFLASVNPRARTPLVARVLAGATILALARILWRDETKRPVPLLVASMGATICAIFLALQF